MKTRQLCLDILYQIIVKKEFSNNLLNQMLIKYPDLSNQDKTLIFKIVYGTLKNKIYLEYVTNKFIDYHKTNQKLQILLWLSVYQFYFLDKIPNYAIVNEAVEISKTINIKVSGFINATLKRILTADASVFAITDKNEIENLSIRYSFPKGLLLILKTQFGDEHALNIIKDSINIPKISLRVNTLKISREELIAKYPQYNLQPSLITSAGVISSYPVMNSEMFKNGEIIMQDEMSIKVVEDLAPQPGELVLDLCAAPGGKTTYLGQLMNNQGHVDAYEIANYKIPLIMENIHRLGLTNIEVHNLDANLISPDQLYDRILLDAPCSGFGVIKRKPEIKYKTWTNEDLFNLVSIQAQLLDKAYQLLKPHGVLVYSTCTFEIYENQEQIKNFVQKYPTMKIEQEEQVFGYEHNSDGFYYCRLVKTK